MNEKKQTLFNAVILSTMAAIFIIVAVLVLFVPQVEIKDICFFICDFIVILGIFTIARYFMSGGYKKFNEYGFSEGVLFLLLGICGLVCAERIADFFLTALGLFLLLSGVTKLQYALDLKLMNDHAWTGFFAVTVVMLGLSLTIILNPFQDEQFYQNFTCYVLLFDGIIEIINIVYLHIRTKSYQKNPELLPEKDFEEE